MVVITGTHQAVLAQLNAPRERPAVGQPDRNPAATLRAANSLVAAPATSARQPANPLDMIPLQWLPNGNTERNFEGRSGFIKLMGGKAQISRTRDLISVNTPNGKFSLKPDAAHPGSVVAVTPQGTFTGQLTGSGNRYDFRTADGKRSLKIEKKSDCVRFDTKGFGASDLGHLNVMDH